MRLLWEACQIPDFRKITDDSQSSSAPASSAMSLRHGTLPVDWLAAQIDRLDRAEGDIDTLMQRLSGVRVWSYIAARADWVQDAAALAGAGPRGRGPALRRAARDGSPPASSTAGPPI